MLLDRGAVRSPGLGEVSSAIPPWYGVRGREEESILTARDVWRWTDERGVQRLVGTDELRAALASSVLSPSTLVWREGMKEWAPASTIAELAGAAFAAGAAPRAGADAAPGQPASASEAVPLPARSFRNTTLLGMPSPGGERQEAGKLSFDVPAAGERAERSGVTQVPPFGAPTATEKPPGAAPAPAIPAAPRAPTLVSRTGAGADLPGKPKRKITTTEIDSLWATTTNSDEDETIPRRPRPSELAAAAAASAEATAALREARAKATSESRKAVLAKMAGPPPGYDGAAGGPKPRAPPEPSPAPRARPADGTASAARPEAAPDGGGGRVDPARVAPKVPAPPEPAPGRRPLPRPPIRTMPGLNTPAPQVAPAAPTIGAEPPQAGGALPTVAGRGAVGPAAGGPKPPSRPVVPAAPVRIHAPPTPIAGASGPDARPAADAGRPMPPRPAETTSTLVSAGESLPRFDDSRDASPLVAMAAEPARSRHDDDEATAPGRYPPGAEPGARNGVTRAEGAPPDDDVGREPLDSFELVGPLPPPRAPMPSHPPVRAPHPSRQAPTPVPETQPSASPPLPSQPPLAASVSPSYPPAARPSPSYPPTGRPSYPPAARPSPSHPPAARPSPSYPPAVPSRPPPSSGSVDVDIMGASGRSLNAPVAVPVSSLLGAGGMLIGMVIAAFFVGRCSASPEPRPVARRSFGAVPMLARAALPPPPKPCWMVKQPAMWAPHVSKNIPFEVVATREGGLAVGYARNANVAMGIEVNLSTGEVRPRFDEKAKAEIDRVVPTPALEFRVARSDGGGALKSPIDVPASTPFAVGLAAGSIALASPPEGEPSPLWPIAGDDGLGAAGVHLVGDRGYALVFRRSGAVWGGFIGADRKPVGELVKVAGSGGSVGKPSGGSNAREVAVIFADRPDPDARYEIRIGHAPAGAVPTTTTVLPLPKGGPGGDAFAPDIAGLPDGRWLLVWTEGAQGSRAVRAQTLTPDFVPLGDPIALSPPAGNYGQGVIGIAGGYAATVFLSKGSSSYELWGAVLQCG
jgi:hypothetical protein